VTRVGRASAATVAAMASRQLPRVGRGDNFVSSIHVDDVGTAVRASLSAPSGVYNVVDDRPLTQPALLAAMAESLEAPPPRALPISVFRVLLGHAARVLAVSHRVSNRRFAEVSGWRPSYATAVEGWRAVAAAGSEVAAA